MQMKIENIPSYRIAYFRQTGPYGIGNKETMENLKIWAKNNGLFNKDSILLGIAQDDPQRTHPDKCRYDTCVVVPQSFVFKDASVHSGDLAGGEYAIFKIRHTEEAVKEGWRNIFPELEKSGLSLDASKPVLERYIVELVENHYCEICIPVK